MTTLEAPGQKRLVRGVWRWSTPRAPECCIDCGVLLPPVAKVRCPACVIARAAWERDKERRRSRSAQLAALKALTVVHVASALRTTCDDCGCLIAIGEPCPVDRVWARAAEVEFNRSAA